MSDLMKNVLIAALGVSLVGSLQASAWAAEAEKKPINLGTLKMAALTNPWVGVERGIFQKHGLDVKLVYFNSGAQAINAAQAGDVDIFLSIPGTVMSADERGFDLVCLFQNEVAKKAGPDSGGLVVLKDSPINTLADLAGKTVGVGGLHSQNTVDAQVTLRKAGVDVGKINFVEIPYPVMPNALKAKQIDAAVALDPYTTQLQSSGVGKVLAWYYIESIPEQPLGGWFAKRAYVKKNPELIAAFNRAMKETIDYMKEDTERARLEVVAYSGLDASLVRDMPMIAWDYNVRLDKWQQVVDMMRESGELQKPHTADEYLSDEIKPYIVK
jgi:NitT/TauT family transport system substrate-binding protein